ncbi:MAG: alpha/beta fold hydrolase [Hyphomicrobiales bacterium]
MKIKKRYLIPSVVIILLVIVAFAMYNMFTSPFYNPGDLKTKEEYKHLLADNKLKDTENYFNISNDISLYYTVKGEGSPVLIIHGGPGMPYERSWKGLEGLEQNHKFYYYHQRGAGKSTRPFNKFESSNMYENMKALNIDLGLPAQIADIEQIRRKLNVDKLTIIGHSFGGFIASLYAIEFPENIDKLILVAPAGTMEVSSGSVDLYGAIEDRLPEDKKEDFRKYKEQIFDFDAMFKMSENELADLNRGIIPFYNIVNNGNESTEAPFMGGWVQNATFISMGKKHDYTPHLKNVKCPTLIIYGENDINPISSVNQYLDNMPNAKLITIPSATHFPFDEQAEAFEKAITSFI